MGRRLVILEAERHSEPQLKQFFMSEPEFKCGTRHIENSEDWPERHHRSEPDPDGGVAPASRPFLQNREADILVETVEDRWKERKVLLKLDIFFLSSIMFGYFIKTLNQNNITTAYMNGMEKDLDLSGSRLNYLQSVWTIGYILGQVPSNLILQRVPPKYYLCILELVWCVLTFLTVMCRGFLSMAVMRFFIGLFEAGFFPAASYLLGSWYSPRELTKRSTFFAQSGVAASILTGYIQAIILRYSQYLGMLPYKWLFVFDALVSLPCALFTLIGIPGTPGRTTAWYLSEEERSIARVRLTGNLSQEPKPHCGSEGLFSTWHIFVFPLIFLAFNNSCNVHGQPTFQSWLKSIGYGPEGYNTYPTWVSLAGMVLSCIFASISDRFNGLNWIFVVLFFCCELIGCTLLAIWNIPDSIHWFCYFLTGAPTSWGQPMIFAWVNRELRLKDSKRSLVVVLTNNVAYITNAFVPIYTWRATDMPQYFIGWTYTAILSIFGLIITGIAVLLTMRDSDRESVQYDQPTVDQAAINENTRLVCT